MAYSLGALGYATGLNADDITHTALNAEVMGASGTPISMSQFTASFSTQLNPNLTSMAAGVTTTWNLVATSIGSVFATKVGNQSRNGTWTGTSGKLTLVTNNGVSQSLQNTATVTGTAVVQVVWNDHYNASVTATDSFTANAPA